MNKTKSLGLKFVAALRIEQFLQFAASDYYEDTTLGGFSLASSYLKASQNVEFP